MIFLSRNRILFSSSSSSSSSFAIQSLWILLLLFWPCPVKAMSTSHIDRLRQETADLFYHGYDKYMNHAFPEDELRPITCGPLTRDRENPTRVELNDVLGNYSLTLIDSLSTLAILASSPEVKGGQSKPTPLDDFQQGIQLLVEQYGDGSAGHEGQGKRARGFDLDSKVQVFETTIRGLGGLLSSHLFAVGDLPILGYDPIVRERNGRKVIHWKNGFAYDGQLLRLAKDLADRLLPAFYSPTGIPYPRVNLRHGVPFYPNSPYNANSHSESGQCSKQHSPGQEITETCSAGSGSLVLEFATLGRLLGNLDYEQVAVNAFNAVWSRRSALDLIGAGIDSESGEWITPITGIGAGVDSFFEYAFKSHILLSNLSENKASNYFLSVWKAAHQAVKRHILRSDSSLFGHYVQADMHTGAHKFLWIDSLSAFYPGLLTLAGEVQEAETAHIFYTALWSRYAALPERYSIPRGAIDNGIGWWGGRPEFIESAWYLYRATKDPWYLHTGEMVLRDIHRRCWTECGWAGLQDVHTGEKSDRMESFFLGETAKYLFLLFSPDHVLNSLDAPFVFTTEGHPLIIPRSKSASPVHQSSNEPSPLQEASSVCPVPAENLPFTLSRVASRDDLYHAAYLARLWPEFALKKNQTGVLPDKLQAILDTTYPNRFKHFPWTLPLDYIPSAGVSKRLDAVHYHLTFPIFGNDNTQAPLIPISRTAGGLLLSTLSNMRFGLIKEPMLNRENLDEGFRIVGVAGISLGRDEIVFLQREAAAIIKEPDLYFTRRFDTQSADLVIDIAVPQDNHTSFDPSEDLLLPTRTEFDDLVPNSGQNDTHLISSIVRNLQYLFSSDGTISANPRFEQYHLMKRHILHVTLPTGQGAFLDEIDAEPPVLLNGSKTSSLSWQSVYFASDTLCDKVLSAEIPREYQVLVVRRGECSFSEKLEHIPAFADTSKSLKLVIVVSSGSDKSAELLGFHEHIQPLLDQKQTSPVGVPRKAPIRMVLLHGGHQAWDTLEKAKGIAIRQKWWFESQGMRIQNLIVV